MDFVLDVTANGKSLEWLAVVDEFTRECMALEVARQFKAEEVLDVLRDLIATRGLPGHLRCDNGAFEAAIRRIVTLALADHQLHPGFPGG